MYYTQSGNIILIRVPKAGSSTAQHLVGSAFQDAIENGVIHETYDEMRGRIKGDFLEQQNWRIIGFVRHPIPWLNSMVSQFWDDCVWAGRWFGGGLKRFDGPDLPARLLLHMDRTPHHWFTDKYGAVRVTEIWRVEDMADFATSLNVPCLHMNETPKLQRREIDWSPKEREIIKLRFARELAYYPEGL